jgi:hypothetical protein
VIKPWPQIPPKHPAAFINEIAESGTKEEAVRHLQQTWDELVDAKQQLSEATQSLRDLEERFRSLLLAF